MTNNRRDFLKLAGLAGVGLSSAALTGRAAASDQSPGPGAANRSNLRPDERFNMAGYAAPKLDKVRIGHIGQGARGTGVLNLLAQIEGAEVRALCDLVPERSEVAAARLKKAGATFEPTLYTGTEDAWKKVCEREDIDVVYISTPWKLHTPIAVYAMNHGKHAVVEVPAARTIDECWQLVEASEKNRRHLMMAQNTCYDFFELLTLNMARQGFFGDIIHGEGAYFDFFPLDPKQKAHRAWRHMENAERNGNLYPTHGIGPVCQAMNINCGDRLDFLVSVSSNDFRMRDELNQAAAIDDFWKPIAAQAGMTQRGNINTTAIRTVNGRTMMMQHDVTTSRPYSRIYKLVGTKAMTLKYPLPARIAVGHKDFITAAEFKALEEKYTPEIVRRVGEMAKKAGGHGGIDFMMNWRLIDCLRNGLPLDLSVYDAATYCAVAPLSEWSVAHRSNSIDFPDFTSGAWKTNPPGMDINLTRGGTTKAL